MTEQRFEANRIQNKSTTGEQQITEITAALSEVLQPESMETAIEVIRGAVADPDNFRREVIQDCIDLESNINEKYQKAQLAEKSLKRSRERLKENYENHKQATQDIDLIKSEIEGIKDYVERIDDEIETLEIEGTEVSPEGVDGPGAGLTETDETTLITMRAKHRYRSPTNDEDDRPSIDAIGFFKGRV